jgi:Skp family chaperone for outer membrane proteins
MKIRSIISMCIMTVGIINADNAPVVININSNNTEAKGVKIAFVESCEVMPRDGRNSLVVEANELTQLISTLKLNRDAQYRKAYYDRVNQYERKLISAVERIAKDKGYDVVLQLGIALYINPAHNITNDVIKLLNKEYLAR